MHYGKMWKILFLIRILAGTAQVVKPNSTNATGVLVVSEENLVESDVGGETSNSNDVKTGGEEKTVTSGVYDRSGSALSQGTGTTSKDTSGVVYDRSGNSQTSGASSNNGIIGVYNRAGSAAFVEYIAAVAIAAFMA